MKILVTGAFGLLGSTLVPYIETCGYEVIKLSSQPRGGITADLTCRDNVNSVLNKISPDIIINLAALTNVDECERNPQKAYLLNGHIVENIAHWMQQTEHHCYLIQFSTDQIYDGTGPHTEEKITLRNYYGFSKYLGELAASNVFSTILRTNFFGASQCGYRTSLSDWIISSLQRKESINVFDDIYFSPLSLNTLVKLVDVVIQKRQPGVYNLGSVDGASKADFAFMLAEELGLSVETMQRSSSDNMQFNAYRPKDMRMDSSQFEQAFDVKLPNLITEIQLLNK
jgi:dTDP-4-dehydrorhamnose reductase